MLERVWLIASAVSRDDVLTHEAIEHAAGIVRYSRHWNPLIGKLKRKLLKDRGIAVRPVDGVGYRLLTSAEQLVIPAEDRNARARRQLNRGIREVDSTPAEGLTAHQLDVKRKTVQGMRKTREALQAEERERACLSEPTDAPPRRRLRGDSGDAA